MCSTRVVTIVSLGVASALAACQGGGAAPEFDDPGVQIAQVGTQLSLTLIATDADGDELDFSFDSTIPDLQTRAQLTRSPSGAAIFRWTPQAADVGDWFVDFSASDGDNSTVLTVEIDVRSAIGGAGSPVFREPLGTGTTLDLAVATCLDVNIVIEDQDSTSVTLAQEEPIIEGAELTGSGLNGNWNWCPTADQADAADRYTLTLSADDGTNPKTLKDYLIVLRKPSNPDCPGEVPAIAHTPVDATTINDLTIDAQISDDVGLKQPPLLYWSTTNPGATPNLGSMTQETMLLITGSMQSGTWAADVPNPVVGMSAGTMRTLYYVIVADDDDDETGDCDHTTQSSVYDATITNGGTGTTGLCEACSNDLQCGGGGDLCVRVGAMADSYCLQTCTSDAGCPSGYTCPTAAVTSVNGASGRQCQPSSGSCEMGTVETCTDDTFEDNDTRSQVNTTTTVPPLPSTGTVEDLVSCPAAGSTTVDDEDYFRIDITQDSMVTIEIDGGTNTDLDLGLMNSSGTLIQSEASTSSDHTISRCLTPAVYYIRVNAYPNVAGDPLTQNDYVFLYDRTNMSCAAACTNDAFEDDDTLATARTTTYPTHTASNQTICTDADWYEVPLFDGEIMTVDLTYTYANGDLDLTWHNSAGVDLSGGQGTSSDDNEHYVFTAPATGCSAGCNYYVKVYGYGGDSNTYGITIAVTDPV